MGNDFSYRARILAEAARQVIPPDVLIVEEAGPLLHMGLSTVRAKLHSGAIPGRKVGKRWYIVRTELFRFLTPSHAIPRFEVVK
jgi:excisionase family DNA binding protein